jgi:predicted transcriptional regulator
VVEGRKMEALQDRKIPCQDICRLAVCSDLRKNILTSLNEGKKQLRDLRDELNVSSTTAIHTLKELERHNLVVREKDKNYSLTNIGRIATLKLLDFSDAAWVLKKHERFWLEHDLSGIPEHLMEKIGWLKDSIIIQISTLDIIKTHSSYVSFIKNAKCVRGVSPIFSSDYPGVFEEIIKKNVNTQLVLTNSVIKKLTENLGLGKLKNFVSNYELELSVTNEDIRVAFTVTDAFLSFGLFSNNGIYDLTQDLVSTDKRSIRWGFEIFEYYRKKAQRYEI